MGILGGVGCPHYDSEHPQTRQPRAENFQTMMREQFPDKIGVAADNQAALRIVGNSFDIMTVGPGPEFTVYLPPKANYTW